MNFSGGKEKLTARAMEMGPLANRKQTVQNSRANLLLKLMFCDYDYMFFSLPNSMSFDNR